MCAALVDQAKSWADGLVKQESRGPGDLARAMRRVAGRHGLTYSILWGLRYRPPKDVPASVFIALREAYLAACERQAKRLQDEIAIHAAAGADPRHLRAVAAAAGALVENDEV